MKIVVARYWQWLIPGFSAVVAMVFYFIGMMTNGFGILNRSPYDFETVLITLYHIIFYFDQLAPKIAIKISLSAFFGVWAYMTYIWSHPFFSKRGYVYPLSCTQRMWIQYWGFLVQNISFVISIYSGIGRSGHPGGGKGRVYA